MQFIINKFYLHKTKPLGILRYKNTCSPISDEGVFEAFGGDKFRLKYSEMIYQFSSTYLENNVTKTDSEFKLNEEIEVSIYKDFTGAIKVKFKHQDPDSIYHGVDINGWMIARQYARKIEPKVTVWFSDENNYVTIKKQISKKLAEQIKRGN